MKKTTNYLITFLSLILFISCNNKKQTNTPKTQTVNTELNVNNINSFDEEKYINEGYQIFKEDNFVIKCEGKILLDKLRIQQMKQNGLYDNSKPYHVYVEGIDYNLNIGNYESVLKGQNKEEILKFSEDDLDYYQTKFDEMGVKNNRSTFKGFDAVYYENTIEGRTTKAVFVHHKMKSYMIQLTSNKSTEELFQNFINTFEFINR